MHYLVAMFKTFATINNVSNGAYVTLVGKIVMKAHYNLKFESAFNSLKELLGSRRFESSSLENWFFNPETEDVAVDWVCEHIPEFDGDLKKLKSVIHLFSFALNSEDDKKYKTEYFLINTSTFNILDNPYFMELVEYFELDNIIVTVENKCYNVVAFLNAGYKAENTVIELRDNWNTSEHIAVYGTAILLSL